MTNNKKIAIAKIVSVHGIKGFVKIVSFCKNNNDLQNYQCFFDDNSEIKIKIISDTAKKTTLGDAILIAKIDGIDNRDKAEKLRDKEIFTTRENFAKLNEDEFYQTDLIGLDVISDGKKIGKITNIFDYGAGDMIEIEFEKEDKTRNLGKVESFPFENQFFGDVDVKKGSAEFKMPEILVIKE